MFAPHELPVSAGVHLNYCILARAVIVATLDAVREPGDKIISRGESEPWIVRWTWQRMIDALRAEFMDPNDAALDHIERGPTGETP